MVVVSSTASLYKLQRASQQTGELDLNGTGLFMLKIIKNERSQIKFTIKISCGRINTKKNPSYNIIHNPKVGDYKRNIITGV